MVSHKVLQWLDGVETYIHVTPTGAEEHLHIYTSAEIILCKFFGIAFVNGKDQLNYYCALCND